MLLQRVNLKGFLAHRGVQSVAGGPYDRPVELDFRGSSLWLVHGPNGSGKSSIFDALTFALYDRARGRGDGFGDFINDVCDRADVEVEVEIGGVSYQINRGVSRGRGGRGAGQNSGQVQRQITSGLQIEGGTTNAVPDWTARTLHLSYENFVSAALLRQGEADVFLKAKPAKRKEQLMKLLDLDVYKRLGEVANARKTQTQNLFCIRQTELAACRLVSDEQVQEARERVERANAALRLADDELGAQTTLWRDAGQAAQWLEDIVAREKQQEQDAPILLETARIEADAERYEALGRALPMLEALWRLREALESEKKTLLSAQEQWKQVEADVNSLAPKLQSARDAEVEAQSVIAHARNQKTAVERDTATLDQDLNSLQRLENLERHIAEAENALAPFRDVLAVAEAVEADFQRFQDLRTASQKLSPLAKSEKKRAQFEAERTAAQKVSETAEEALDAAQNEAEAREKNLAQLDADIETLRPHIENLSRRLHTLREKLEHREGLQHADDCPTCGSHLQEPETRARLQAERKRWSVEAENLTLELQALEERRKGLQSAKNRAAAELKNARNAEREADNRKTSTRQDESNARRRLDDAARERDDYRSEAGEYANRISDFEAICSQCKRLKSDEIEARHQQLLEARQQTREAQTTTGIYRRQLRDELPQWSPSERRALREREVENQRLSKEADAAEEAAQIGLADAIQALETLEGQRETLSHSQERLRGQCEDGTARVQRAEKKVEAEFASLPTPWGAHAAAHDAEELKALRGEFADLANAPQRLETLRAAQGRLNALRAQIEILRGNIEKLPLAHRIAPDVALGEKKSAEEVQKTRLAERDEAIGRLGSDERAREDYQRCHQKRDEAERAFSRADKLARAFGPSGLQAKIVSEAQRTIGALANETLAKLSQGNWQIDLRENSAGTELEIIARDLGRGGRERPFECLSGGERFRVAISLAIAIGQSACGGQAVNTLVIDEGFGALDDLNRGLLVDELRRLSEQVLRGGRIIIVSHQDDVCSEFDFRYQISRDTSGYAQALRFTP